MNVKVSNDIVEQLKKLSGPTALADDTVKDIAKIFDKVSSPESIDTVLAKRLGQYFYYYSQIDGILEKIVKSLLPELDLSIMGLDSSYEGNSFKKKVELIKSLTPNSSQLKIFPLLDKVNRIRNVLAHASPDKVDLTKLNSDLVKLFREAFFIGDTFVESITKSDGSKDSLGVSVKTLLATKIFLELFADIEILGKKAEKPLRFFEAIRKFSSLYVRRRFSILAYQFQTRIESGKVSDEFKQIGVIDAVVDEIDKAFKDLFGVSEAD